MNKRTFALIAGALVGYFIGASLVTSSICTPSVSGWFGCGNSSEVFLKIPFALVGALAAWYLVKD